MKAWHLFILLFLAATLALWPWGIDGDFERLKSSYSSSGGTQTFLDREGQVLHVTRHQSVDRRLDWVELDSIPKHLFANLLMMEDRRFYDHRGIDFIAMISAINDSRKLGKLRGASTISMQLAGLLENQGPRSRNLFRKLRQLSGAVYLEMKWTKDEILEAYVNLLTFRHDLVGIGAAARGLFQKETHGLTREETLILSALLSSPNTKIERVIAKACSFSDLSTCKRIRTLAENHLNRRGRLPKPIHSAPHYIRQFQSSDSVVQTTLDKQLQEKAQELISEQMQNLSKQNVRDAAAVVFDYQKAELVAYVGSSGKFSNAREVDAAKALRQAGSTLKPLLYAKAIDEGLITQDTLIDDSSYQVQTPGGLYTPQNYDESFKGIVPAKIALAASLNIPAVKVIDLLTVDSFYLTLSKLGFTLAPRSIYGHSLALGAADVSLLQLVKAYASLASRAPPFKAATSKIIEEILSSKDNRASTFGLENALATPYRTAVKTGTSKDMRDNWCIGWDGRYVAGVWVGNANGTPMWNVSGITGAAPIWRSLMDELQYKRNGSLATSIQKVDQIKPEVLQKTLSEIIYPLNGTLIAFDPDIPEENQVLVLEHSTEEDLLWRLDGQLLPHNFLSLADLPPGKHVLTLSDKRNRLVDRVGFELRGKSSELANAE